MKFDLYPTVMCAEKLEIDNDKLMERIDAFHKDTPSTNISNVGGYQGHNFEDEELVSAIIEATPTMEGKQFLGDLICATWVNINKKDSFNTPHTHLDTQVLISGTYYVKTPENCGRIRFHDPRGSLIAAMPDYQYYYNGESITYITPEPGMCLYFPPWLEHDVEPNNSDDIRVSVSFNILFPKT